MLPDMQWMSITEGIEEFAHNMKLQSDLKYEAENLNTFNENFKGDSHIIFPRPIDGLASPLVLVETWEDGKSIANYIEKKDPINPKIAKLGMEAYLKMMLVHNFIHADLHPGNILVRVAADEKVSLIFLDVGLISKLSGDAWVNFKDLFLCIVNGDGVSGAGLMIQRSEKANMTEKDKEEFVSEMSKLFGEVRRLKLASLDVGRFMSNVLNLCRQYHVKLESRVSTLVIGTIILEGIGRQLDPNVNILDASLPFLLKTEQPLTFWDRVAFVKRKILDFVL